MTGVWGSNVWMRFSVFFLESVFCTFENKISSQCFTITPEADEKTGRAPAQHTNLPASLLLTSEPDKVRKPQENKATT